MAASQRRKDELGEALVMASENGNVLDMCRLINQGADVEYVVKAMQGGVEISMTPLTQGPCGRCESADQLQCRCEQAGAM
jgi:hypothetical protein